MLGLLKGDPWARYLLPPWTINVHRFLGVMTLMMAWAHFLLFFTAVSLRKDAIAYDLLLPELNKGYYFIGVSLGWFALVSLNLVALAGILRNRTGGIWTRIHRLSLAVFLATLVHAQMIGSEAKGGLWMTVQLPLAALLILALARRLVRPAMTSPITVSNHEEAG